MKSVLITGIYGFVGTHLCRHLLESGYKVSGIERSENGKERYAGLFGEDDSRREVRVYYNSLDNISELSEIISAGQFDYIYHLAGTAFVPLGWKDPAAIVQANTLNTVNLLQAARDVNWKGRFLFISSSDVYGKVGADDMPITESTPVAPNTPYAASKLAGEHFSLCFCEMGIDVIIARPFNHIGPGQNPDFVVPAFLRRIDEAKREGQNSIAVGDLEAGRDFTDVRDVVRAYELLLDKGLAGEIYVVSSGVLCRIGEVLEVCQKVVGSTLETRVDDTLKRVEGPDIRFGESRKLQALGWAPKIDLEKSVRDTHTALKKSALT